MLPPACSQASLSARMRGSPKDVGETSKGRKGCHDQAGSQEPGRCRGNRRITVAPEYDVAHKRGYEEGNRNQHGMDRVPSDASGATRVSHRNLHLGFYFNLDGEM